MRVDSTSCRIILFTSILTLCQKGLNLETELNCFCNYSKNLYRIYPYFWLALYTMLPTSKNFCCRILLQAQEYVYQKYTLYSKNNSVVDQLVTVQTTFANCLMYWVFLIPKKPFCSTLLRPGPPTQVISINKGSELGPDRRVYWG